MPVDHEELDAEVIAIRPWGYVLDVGDGMKASMDNTKTLHWKGLSEPLELGNRVRVVVLDDTRTPCRVSALPEDFHIAKSLRDKGGQSASRQG
ncbi:hypothetical protein AB0C02_33510 [Micromonospora sp. NPDC048999]|uniref:hypothetical protein n=1 Tax=Micromonospora sp. NPDC048999 TaxID=3155391 RepID=UPI003402ACBA